MGLLELVQHRGLRIGAHARDAHLVTRPARRPGDADVGSAGRLEHLGGLLCAVAHHGAIGLGKPHVDPDGRDAPGIDRLRVDGHLVARVWHRLAEAAEVDRGATAGLDRGDVGGAEPAGVRLDRRRAAPLIAVATRKPWVGFLRVEVAEPRDEQARRFARRVLIGRLVEGREVRRGAEAGEMRQQVLAEDAARIGEPGRVLRPGGVQQQAHRLERLRRQDDDAPMDLVVRPRRPVDVPDAGGASRLRVHQDLRRHRLRDDAAASRLLGVEHRGVRRVEVGEGGAAALARPAHVARRAPVDRCGQVRGAPLRDGAPHAGPDGGAHMGLDAREAHGRLQTLVGQLRNAFVDAGDADVALDLVVVGREVGRRQRPVDAEAVTRGRTEIDVAVAIALAPPHVRPATDDAHPPDPGERLSRRRRVRLVDVVDEPVGVPLREGVAGRLLRLRARDDGLGAGPQRQGMRRDVLAEVFRTEGASGVQHDDAQPRLGQTLGRPASRGARADDDDVGRVGTRAHRLHAAGGRGLPPDSRVPIPVHPHLSASSRHRARAR